MTLPSNLLTHNFTIKRTSTGTSSGKLTRSVSTNTTSMNGRIEPLSEGGQEIGVLGKTKFASHRLFANVDQTILVGDIVIDESNSQEFDVIRAEKHTLPGIGHHWEVYMEETRRNIA